MIWIKNWNKHVDRIEDDRVAKKVFRDKSIRTTSKETKEVLDNYVISGIFEITGMAYLGLELHKKEEIRIRGSHILNSTVFFNFKIRIHQYYENICLFESRTIKCKTTINEYCKLQMHFALNSDSSVLNNYLIVKCFFFVLGSLFEPS